MTVLQCCAIGFGAVVVVSSSHVSGGQRDTPARVPVYGYSIVKTYPHDPLAYTQGLLYRSGFLFESTGLHGRSSIRKVRLDTGDVVQQLNVQRQYFAEGLTDWDGRLIQLTWQSRMGFIYDMANLRPLGTFTFAGEGWGLTHDATRLILSDGSDRLRFLDPKTFSEVGRIAVTDRMTAVRNLNELEYVNGEIYANVWHTDRIARISPESGHVVGWIDLTGLLSPAYRRDPEGVLNGIAFDAQHGRLFVTGKLWPRVFEIRLVPRP